MPHPTQNNADIVIGFSQSAASAYTDLAAIIRFSPTGTIDVRNGGTYGSAVALPYAAGTNYHVRMVVNVPVHTYSVFVTPQGESEVTLASNYAFRTEQAAVTSLANVAHFGDPGSAPVINLSVLGADTTPPSTPTNLSATAISSSQINLSWTASTDNVGVTGYKIFRGGVQIATSATNSYFNTGLTASTAYSYTVSAYDAAGNNSARHRARARRRFLRPRPSFSLPFRNPSAREIALPSHGLPPMHPPAQVRASLRAAL